MTRSTSQAAFHPNKLHLFSCLSIYTLGSAGGMKSAANKSYNSALANASLRLNYPKVTKGPCSKTGLLRIVYRTGHHTFKWNYYCVEAWDSLPWKTKSPSCHKTKSGTSREICPLNIFQLRSHRGLKSWLRALPTKPAPLRFSARSRFVPNAIPALNSCQMGTGSVVTDLGWI